MKLPLWRLRTWRRKLCEAVGIRHYSVPCPLIVLEGLQRHFPQPSFFVEAGAVDGYFESNTYCFERFRGWRGILIEPIPEMYARLKVNRPLAVNVHSALVADEYEQPRIAIQSAHATSKVLPGDTVGDLATTVDVPARTLTSVLEEAAPETIDLLSLDVEGYEIHVLRGLDMTRYCPRFLLIECLTADTRVALEEFLGGRYRLVEQLTHRDYLCAATQHA